MLVLAVAGLGLGFIAFVFSVFLSFCIYLIFVCDVVEFVIWWHTQGMMGKANSPIILRVYTLPCPPVHPENDGKSEFPHHSQGLYAQPTCTPGE